MIVAFNVESVEHICIYFIGADFFSLCNVGYQLILHAVCVFEGEICSQGVQDVFVLCERSELVRYRVPCLLECYTQWGLKVHHLPFPDGGTPELQQCTRILEELQHCLDNQRRTVIQSVQLYSHYFGHRVSAVL